jgi:hypothetical protein
MLAHQVVLPTLSISLRLSQSASYKKKEQSPSHSPYTLPSSVSCKPCVCHSYENCRGWGYSFPIWNLWARTRFLFKPFVFTLLRTLLHHEKLNSFVFMRFCTLCAKHPGVGYPYCSHESRQFAFSPHPPNNELAVQPGIYPDSVGMDEGSVFEFRISTFAL